MYDLFVVITLFGLAFFTLRKRQFDFFTIAFFSSIFYFIPGYLGIVLDYSKISHGAASIFPIYWECYIVYCLVQGFLIVGAFIHDTIRPFNRFVVHLPFNTRNVALYSNFLAYFGVIMAFLVHRDVLFMKDKVKMLTLLEGDRWTIIWSYCATFACIFSFIYGNKKLLMLSTVPLILDLFVGFRSATLFSIIGIVTISLHNKGVFRLGEFIYKPKKLLYTLLFLFVGLFFFVYKSSLYWLKRGDYDSVIENVLTPAGLFSSVLIHSEPYPINLTLHTVLQEQIKTDMIQPLDVLASTIFFSDLLGIQTDAHYLKQEDIVGRLDFGLASNMWAFMWSSGGWYFLIAFIFIFTCSLSLGSALLNSCNSFGKGVILFYFIVLAFYIHRNDFFIQFVIQKRILLFASFIFFLCLIHDSVANAIKKTLAEP